MRVCAVSRFQTDKAAAGRGTGAACLGLLAEPSEKYERAAVGTGRKTWKHRPIRGSAGTQQKNRRHDSFTLKAPKRVTAFGCCASKAELMHHRDN